MSAPLPISDVGFGSVPFTFDDGAPATDAFSPLAELHSLFVVDSFSAAGDRSSGDRPSGELRLEPAAEVAGESDDAVPSSSDESVPTRRMN